jgi:hypothetical protein
MHQPYRPSPDRRVIRHGCRHRCPEKMNTTWNQLFDDFLTGLRHTARMYLVQQL